MDISFEIQQVPVLIETLWNVKDEVPDIICLIVRINRNIVECKELLFTVTVSFHVVLIETLWNVKEVGIRQCSCFVQY